MGPGEQQDAGNVDRLPTIHHAPTRRPGGFFLYFYYIARDLTWKEYAQLPILLAQTYLLLLWLLPREIWNVAGLLISGILGLIILVLPDLPSSFDDFGMFGAILAFFLGYLNMVASLVQRAEILIRKVKK